MAHIDPDSVSTLDALIDVSDAGARAALARLREELERLDPTLDRRVVQDGVHHKPALVWQQGGETLLHAFPEPNVRLGLSVAVPVPDYQFDLLDLRTLDPTVRDAALHARRDHQVRWIELVLHAPDRVDALLPLLRQRLDLLPRH